MRNIITMNRSGDVMLTHDWPLDFIPSWVEISSSRGIRVMSTEGLETRMGSIGKNDILPTCKEILLVQVKDQAPVTGYALPLVVQHYS
jgi:hypothetical protein